MNKKELTQALARRTNITQTQAAHAVDAVVNVIGDSLAAGERVTISGFGTFSVGRRGERKGVNPQTGEATVYPARAAVRFKAGAPLASSVAGS